MYCHVHNVCSHSQRIEKHEHTKQERVSYLLIALKAFDSIKKYIMAKFNIVVKNSSLVYMWRITRVVGNIYFLFIYGLFNTTDNKSEDNLQS